MFSKWNSKKSESKFSLNILPEIAFELWFRKGTLIQCTMVNYPGKENKEPLMTK